MNLEELVRDVPQSELTLHVYLFIIVSYLGAALCVYAAVVYGARSKDTRWPIARELAVLAFFAVSFWFFESWAQFRTAVYAYSMTFWDMVPRLTAFEMIPALKKSAATGTCVAMVREVQSQTGYGIPLSVILMESALTYAGYRASKSAKRHVAAQPLFAGLCVFVIDLLLDPIVATAHGCPPQAASPHTGLPVHSRGVGLWDWYVSGWHPTPDQGRPFATFFEIPLFNYAAWLCGPVALVAIVNLAGQFRREHAARRKNGAEHGVHWAWGFVLVFCVVLRALVAVADDANPLTQTLVFIAIVAAAVVALVIEFGTFMLHSPNMAILALPAAGIVLLLSTIGVTGGWFAVRPYLVLAFGVGAPLTLALAWLPYREWAERFVNWMEGIDAFARVHYFGFTAILLLLGAATTDQLGTKNQGPDTAVLLALLGVGVCFHVYSYVMNDLLDLELDKKNPLRQKDPLVKGTISTDSAWGIVSAAVFMSVIIVFALHKLSNGTPAMPFAEVLAVLGAAYGLMALYNVYGKKQPRPWLTDLAQGTAWGLLALFGALLSCQVEGASRTAALRFATLPLCVYGAGFIFLINGIHGGLRDLKTDKENHRFTMAIVLGGHLSDDGEVESTTKIRIFAHFVHLVMFAAGVVFLSMNEDVYSPWHYAASIILLTIAFVVSFGLLLRVVKTREPKRQWFISAHLAWLMTPPMFVFLPADHLALAFRLTVPVFVFLPLLAQGDVLEWILAYAYASADAPSGDDDTGESPGDRRRRRRAMSRSGVNVKMKDDRAA